MHAVFDFFNFKEIKTNILPVFCYKLKPQNYYPPILSRTPPQSVAVKQIATIQSALKPNTASTDPVSSVSPVGSAGMELPWLASASLPLETQPP